VAYFSIFATLAMTRFAWSGPRPDAKRVLFSALPQVF
jgi:hypothetical protein